MDYRNELDRLLEKAGLCLEGDAICRRNGTRTIKMSNFLVVPSADVEKSDGCSVHRFAEVVVYVCRGGEVIKLDEVTISIAELNNMEWVWSRWGLLCHIYPPLNTNKEYLRAAMFELAADLSKKYICTNTGWCKVQNEYAFTYNGGSVGSRSIAVELESGLGGYRLSEQDFDLTDMENAVKAIFDVAPAKIILPLIALAFLSPLNEFFRQADCEPAFVLYLLGKTQSCKSTLAALILSFFGDFTSSKLPMSFKDTSNALEKKCFILKDVLTVVDDFHPVFSSADKTAIYFPTVAGMYKYVSNYISKEPVLDELDNDIKALIAWAKDEIHEEWSVVKALERGYAIHNGQMPLGIRLFQLNLYENYPNYNRLLCTSTLLEGVNTSAKNIIITKPSRKSDKNTSEDNFSAFDFYNLVGRTGRLNQHYIGDAYYLKAPTDPPYKKIDAIKSIKFELTDDSKDIDIQKGNIDEHDDYIAFLSQLGITHEDYLKNIGSHFRFDTIKYLYYNYCSRKSEIITELRRLAEEKIYGRSQLVKILYAVCEGKEDSFRANLLNNLINRNRPKIRTVVNEAMKYYASRGIDVIISTAIKLKTSYIEHQFYAKLIIVKYFMMIDKIPQIYLDTLDSKVVGAIEQLYFSTSKQKKMLLDIGIYERDVDTIIKFIENDFEDAFEMKKRLLEKFMYFKSSISYISAFIINNL